MFNVIYSVDCQFNPSLICESLPEPCSPPQLSTETWSDDEVARIRIVLQRITSLRVLNEDDAEDIVQETLLTMALKCPEARLEKGLLIWGMGILRNKVGNYYRRIHRFATLNEYSASAENITYHASAWQSPEIKMRHAELCTLIDLVLDDFEPKERKAMNLLLAGLPAGEIADQLHPERYQTVINWLHRGRKKLAKELAKYGYRSVRGRRHSAIRRGGRKKRLCERESV